TFAGSPDRIEAQLVPEAGYELDTFRISGLPRRPSPALARALLLAARAPRACARILAEHRPDVVLRGGGYVAVTVVYAGSGRPSPTSRERATTTSCARRQAVLTTASSRSPRSSALHWEQATSYSRAPGVRSGSLRRRGSRPCSFPGSSPPATIRQRTPATSSG